jgi:ADP-ribosyl-[dinitrogen reductase] hydrolase
MEAKRSNPNFSSSLKGAFWGFIVGDALGVPHEFKPREYLEQNVVTEMTGFGTHKQPAGTWSDDSSLTLALAESLIHGYDLHDIADRMLRWYRDGEWSATAEVFDIGAATINSIIQLSEGVSPTKSGATLEKENGNGSLMRILPLAFFTYKNTIFERYSIVKETSSITHAHDRSIIACMYYVELVQELVRMNTAASKTEILHEHQIKFKNTWQQLQLEEKENVHFEGLFNPEIPNLSSSAIKSSGYVIHTLEATVWCFTTSNSYKEAVLKAVNLGEDTDTIAALTGALAGAYYSKTSIPKDWMSHICKKKEIEYLIKSFLKSVTQV